MDEEEEEKAEEECQLLHSGHQEVQQLADVVGRVEDLGVVGQFLQHLQTLRHTVTYILKCFASCPH